MKTACGISKTAGWLAVLWLLAACSLSPAAPPTTATPSPTPPASPTPVPYFPAGDWPSTTPEEQGMDSAQLVTMLERIRDKGYPIHAIFVVRNGYRVLEAYVHPFRAGERHQLASGTKSITSALVGVALQSGAIGGLDDRLLDYFPGRTVAALDAQKEAVTLRDLLTMSSGYFWLTHGLTEYDAPDMIASPDWVQFALDRKVVNPPGTTFNYDSAGVHLLAAVLEQATGQTPFELARQRLFGPLGIEDVYWPADPSGLSVGYAGLELLPADMAKIGYLYLHHGTWDGRALLPAGYVADSTRAQIDTGHLGLQYGYLWWIDPASGAHARGYGGQYIYVLPEQNMVVVFLGGFDDANMETVPPELLKSYILPAAVSSGPLPANRLATLALQIRLEALAHPQAQPVPALPAVAGQVSGRSYSLEANRLGIQAFRLAFAPPAGQATITLDMAQGRLPLGVGLDGVYRYTPVGEGGAHPGAAIAALGAWLDEETFVLHVLQAGYPVDMRFTFDGDAVRVWIEADMGKEYVSGTLLP